MVNNKKYDEQWEELASMLSGEQEEKRELLEKFMPGDDQTISRQWKNMAGMDEQKEIDVDKAWNKVSSRLRMSEEKPAFVTTPSRSGRIFFLKIAAVFLLLISLTAAFLYIYNKGILTGMTTVATNSSEMNKPVRLPDGSNVYLNRNTTLTYNSRPARYERNVTLSGEAFFEITSDASHAFTVNTGRANVKVLGTSFNVIARNDDPSVEVFVKTGKVMLADSSGSRSLTLDPGYVGIMDPQNTGKKLNDDPNYMSWNTGRLTYDGQKLDIVFRDLKKLYNIEIVVTDAEILNLPIDTSFNNVSHETIIRIICTTFNLNYSKDGNIYHLGKK